MIKCILDKGKKLREEKYFHTLNPDSQLWDGIYKDTNKKVELTSNYENVFSPGRNVKYKR